MAAFWSFKITPLAITCGGGLQPARVAQAKTHRHQKQGRLHRDYCFASGLKPGPT